jgi:hypothetical protein
MYHFGTEYWYWGRCVYGRDKKYMKALSFSLNFVVKLKFLQKNKDFLRNGNNSISKY